MHACILSSAAEVDHLISAVNPQSTTATPKVTTDLRELAAEDRRALPVLHLLLNTASWMSQAAVQSSLNASASDLDALEQYNSLARHAEVWSHLVCISWCVSSFMSSVWRECQHVMHQRWSEKLQGSTACSHSIVLF